MDIASLFSGCGGLDLGFERAGFNLVFANDIDPDTWETFNANHKQGILDKRSITEVSPSDIPEVVGIIGGPPCQSWSLAGAMRGICDPRGKLFYEYVRLLEAKKPLFFLAENVPGIVSSAHIQEFKRIIEKLSSLGYKVSYKVVNARDYGVPQDRKRVIVVGYHNKLGKPFSFPDPTHKGKLLTLKEAIGDLPPAVPAMEKNRANSSLEVPNHEYMNGGFSTIYMSRNRRRSWDEQSFTIQAGGRHAPIHPGAEPMSKLGPDSWEFSGSKSNVPRRLSVRECARIQTFPDDFIFYYKSVASGYKLIGNAVPVRLAEAIAKKIKQDLQDYIGKKDGR